MTGFFNNLLIIRLIASFVATIAFSLMFKVRPRHLFACGIAGTLTYFIYYAIEFAGVSLFVAALASTAFAASYAEFYARVFRAPALIVLSGAIIPIVPGGNLYYTVQHIFTNEMGEAIDNLVYALEIGLGLACGIVLVSVLSKLVSEYIIKRFKKA